MTKLSPAAQAVRQAAINAEPGQTIAAAEERRLTVQEISDLPIYGRSYIHECWTNEFSLMAILLGRSCGSWPILSLRQGLLPRLPLHPARSL